METYGDGFGATPDGLTLERLVNAPHGIDLGPLRPRLLEILRTGWNLAKDRWRRGRS